MMRAGDFFCCAEDNITPLVTTRPVCAPCVRFCTALLRREPSIILILRPAPEAIALRELFCILERFCPAAVALRFRDLLHHKISKKRRIKNVVSQ